MTRILLVDDDAATRQALRTLFEDEGYGVDEAHDLNHALAILTSSANAYVAVFDLFLPQMSGMALLNAIDRDRALAERHAFVATSASLTALAPFAHTMLARLHIPLVPKPFDVDTISSTVAGAAAGLLPWSHATSAAMLYWAWGWGQR